MPILTPEERFGQRVAERYRLQEVLCTGGMGVLFRALDEETGAQVAVKMLKPVYALEPDRVARFVRETRVAAELRHPHLVAVLEVWTAQTEVPFLIMELLEGRSLAHELDARGVLEFDEALSLALPIIDALTAAHAVGVIHRDIKPSNIFLCEDGAGRIVPKLLDFGIAKCQHDDFETQTGMVLGTPGYMAPEQAQLGECSAATDVWAMGAVLYRCLTGHPPHASESTPELLRKLVRDPVPPLCGVGLNKQLAATIDRALMRDPLRRYASMEAFGRALQAAAGRGPCADSAPDPQTEATKPEEVLAPLSAAVAPRSRERLLIVAACLLAAVFLLWTLEPPSAVGDEPARRSAQLDRDPALRVAASTTAIVLESEPEMRVPSPVDNMPSAKASPTADPPRRAKRRPSEILRAQSTRAPAATAIDTNASQRAIIESEATTGLPVATEW